MQNKEYLSIIIYDKQREGVFMQKHDDASLCEGGDVLHLKQMVRFGQEIVGHIEIGYTPCYFQQKLNENTLILTLTLFGQLLLSVGLLIWLLNTRVIQPFKLLAVRSKMADISQMFASIAHQWRQPLSELSNYILNLEMSLRMKGRLESQPTLDVITRSNRVIQSMSETIDTFLTLQHSEKTLQPFDIQPAIHDALLLLDHAIKSRGIDVQIDTESSASILGERNHLVQTLFCLFNNSIEAHQERSTSNPVIWIKASCANSECKIRVEDNAGGIMTQPIEKIFEPHYSHGKKSGSGLGLYLSHMMIGRMGGSIRVKNTKDGARFDLSIPIKS